MVRLVVGLGALLWGGGVFAQAQDAPCAPGQMRCTTPQQRAAAAAEAKKMRQNRPQPMAPLPGGIPDYFGPYPNWGYTPPLRKFVDTLPQLGVENNLHQALTVAVADTRTFPGSDYYELGVKDFCIQMHSDLPPVTTTTAYPGCTGGTRLRGYYQINNGTNAGGTAENVAPPPQRYLGPEIVAQKGRAVRIKFVNQLPTSSGFGPSWQSPLSPDPLKGDLFIPTDTTAMGAGAGYDFVAKRAKNFSQNRATLHLHGGNSPWISDGTPHQWTAPAGENGTVNVLKGIGTAYVPDMWFDASGNLVRSCAGNLTCGVSGATNNPGAGGMTFYYTNEQSARLLFYHDHVYGITRLNVYAGEAAGFIIQDETEKIMVGGGTLPDGTVVAPGTIPAEQIPLIVQDKTFVDAATIHPVAGVGGSDPTWWFGTDAKAKTSAAKPVTGDLWFPHIYMASQNPASITGASPAGRWDYGPFFWPLFTNVANPPLLPTDPRCINSAGWDQAYFRCPAFPTPASLVPEGFMDTPVINGTAYPKLVVQPKPYRFRILNAANDRSMNLSLFQATSLLGIGVTDNGAGYVTAPAVTITGCNGSPTATSTLNAAGGVAAVTVTLQPTACPGPITVALGQPPAVAGSYTALAVGAYGVDSEVKMVPAFPGSGFPDGWPVDARAGGVPDPLTSGPSWLVIGTESGFLPQLAVIKPQPTNYVYNRRDIVVLNVKEHSLFLQPAERIDTVVDFSPFAGKTLILYNDSPSPVPAGDLRNDFYTGGPDFSMETGDGTGGHATTLPGMGPNIRTIMQIVVEATPAPTTWTQQALAEALPHAFAAAQPPPLIPEPEFNAAYGKSFATNIGRIQATSLTFVPLELAGVSNATTTVPLMPKAIQELFEMDYGRMNATLGVELPFTTSVTQTTIPYGFIDPPTEFYAGTNQFWKITHNGVDSHPVHFHHYDVQILNRVGWDGNVRRPDPTEVGWKETVRMNPLEDIIVAARPNLPKLPFPLMDSFRPFDVTRALGTSGVQFTNVDPLTGNPVTVTNTNYNFGHEYVWHCHILGHEENDFMRPMVVRKTANDFNFDQNPDLIFAATNGTPTVYFLDGTTVSRTASMPKPSTDWAIVGYGDFNNDGNPDVLLRYTKAGTTQGQLAVWYLSSQNVTTSTGNVSAYLKPPWTAVAVADYDHDGSPDILYRNSTTGQVQIWRMNNRTVLQRAILAQTLPNAWQVVGSADIDGDGTPDIVWRNTTSALTARNNNVVWYMDPALTVKGTANLPALPLPGDMLVGVGDMNSDGHPDLIVKNSVSPSINLRFVYLNGITQLDVSPTVLSLTQDRQLFNPR